MVEIETLLQILQNYYKSVFAIGGMLLITLASTSCACAGLSCSVGTESTHKALNDRLVIIKSSSIAGGESWAK